MCVNQCLMWIMEITRYSFLCSDCFSMHAGTMTSLLSLFCCFIFVFVNEVRSDIVANMSMLIFVLHFLIICTSLFNTGILLHYLAIRFGAVLHYTLFAYSDLKSCSIYYFTRRDTDICTCVCICVCVYACTSLYVFMCLCLCMCIMCLLVVKRETCQCFMCKEWN